MTDPIEVEATERDVEFDVQNLEIAPLIQGAIVEGDEYKFPILWTAADQLHKELRSLGIVEGMISTTETVKEDKKLRASINKGKGNFEDSRKSWQREETKKHKDFLGQAQDTVLSVYDEYSAIINKSINDYEEEQKIKIENNGRAFWDELQKVLDLEFVDFEDLQIKIGVNTTDNQLIKMIEEHADKFSRDLKLIALQPEPERVLEKYQLNLDLTESLLQIADENKIYEEMKRKEEAKKEAELPTENVPTVDTPTPVHKEVETQEVSPVVTVVIELRGTKSSINWLLNAAEENSIEVVKADEVKQNKFF